MAITAQALLSGDNASRSEVTLSSGLATIADNLYLTLVWAQNSNGTNPPTPTLTGSTGTWSLVETATVTGSGTTRRRIFLFRTMGDGSTGAVTLTFGSVVETIGWAMVRFADVATGGTHGSEAIVQTATANTTTSSLTVNLAGFEDDTNNAVYGALGKANNSGISPGSGFTELAEEGISGSRIQAQWKLGEDTSVDWSWTTNTSAAGIAVEIRSVDSVAKGTATGELLLVGSAEGGAPGSGTVTGGAGLTGSAAGGRDSDGTASGAAEFAGSITSETPETIPVGTAAGAAGFTGAASGLARFGTAAGSSAWATVVQGNAPASGEAATGATTWSVSVKGLTPPPPRDLTVLALSEPFTDWRAKPPGARPLSFIAPSSSEG